MTKDTRWVIDVEEADFERDVIARSRELPVVVDFWAEWCGPCRTLGPLLEKLAEEGRGRFLLAKVDVERAPALAMAFAVQAIPAVKAFQDGKVVDGFVGLLPEPQIREFLSRLGPTEAAELAARAEKDEKKDPESAEQLYRRALELDSHLDRARLGLVRVLLHQEREAEAEAEAENLVPAGDLAEEIERVQATLYLRKLARESGDPEALRRESEADPENAELRYRLGCAEAAAGRYEDALGTLLSAAELDRSLARNKVREVMVQVFYLVGSKSPLANDYRRKLGRLLY